MTVNVTRNTDAIKTLVANFVTAYNQLNSFLSQATHYDASTKQAALLQGDGTTTGIQNQLHALIGQKSGASSAFSTLSSIGVQVQKDGSLKLDDATFANARHQPARADQGAVERRPDDTGQQRLRQELRRLDRRTCSPPTAPCRARLPRSRRGSRPTRRTRTR